MFQHIVQPNGGRTYINSFSFFQESSSAQQSVYYGSSDFLSGNKTNDFSSIQGTKYDNKLM